MASLIDQHSFHTVFFDAGGTLIQSPSFFDFMAEQLGGMDPAQLAPLLKQRFTELYRGPGAEFRLISDVLVDTFASVAEDLNLPDQSSRAPELYRALFLEHAGLFDDVFPVLDYLRERRIRLILISDADADLLYEELKKFGIYDRFEAFVVSSEVRAYKPTGPIVAAARAYCREPLDRILLVGDDLVDVLTAKRLGVMSVAVHRPDAHEYGADYTFQRLGQLIEDRSDG